MTIDPTTHCHSMSAHRKCRKAMMVLCLRCRKRVPVTDNRTDLAAQSVRPFATNTQPSNAASDGREAMSLPSTETPCISVSAWLFQHGGKAHGQKQIVTRPDLCVDRSVWLLPWLHERGSAYSRR